MKVQEITVKECGGPEALQLEERTLGDPGPGQVRIRTRACGVNFIDVYFRTGAYPRSLPFVAGLEGAGVIEAVGPDAGDFAEGDRVAWSAVPGSYASGLLAPTVSLVRVPDAVRDDIAAAAMLQGMTAHYLVHGTRDTRPGDTVLVHAAAGGAGLLLVQMLKAAGATVFGTCSTEEKETLARAAGADHVIRYSEREFAPEVRQRTEGRGVDVVYDSVGRDTFEGSLSCLRPRGLLVLFGQSSGAVPPFDLGRLNGLGSLFVTRPSLAHYTATREELEMRAAAVFDAITRGHLDIRFGAECAHVDAAAAHRALVGRATTGKVLLRP
jgi:NADPH2:quinone reductase